MRLAVDESRDGCAVGRVEGLVDFVEEVEGGRVAALDGEDEGESDKGLLPSRELCVCEGERGGEEGQGVSKRACNFITFNAGSVGREGGEGGRGGREGWRASYIPAASSAGRPCP